jgi:hypothetical protein
MSYQLSAVSFLVGLAAGARSRCRLLDESR